MHGATGRYVPWQIGANRGADSRGRYVGRGEGAAGRVNRPAPIGPHERSTSRTGLVGPAEAFGQVGEDLVAGDHREPPGELPAFVTTGIAPGYCVGRGGRSLAFEVLDTVFIEEAGTLTLLIDGTCWYPTGTDPSACTP